MDQVRHERVSELFSRTIDLPPDRREAFLRGECGEDRTLFDEVWSLLAHDEDESILGAAEDLLPQDLAPGERVGRYRILEKIGEGGMGVVYLAEQERPIRRRVALKIIKLGMDTREVVARFEAERQALAMMDHPNIARVLDAGATERGRPYFVMEHVPGVPITAYCDTQRLNTRERLELFMPVCRAIQHAHQKAIIHRDIKPSNVLVMVQDGKPVPKVIDFGVAKAINQRLTEKTLFTAQGRLIGTPVYMSPEQAEMTGLQVDTTTDVYSLGVMLYELLVGVPPFDPQALLKAGLEAVYRIIREEEPPRPSTRISTLGDGAATVALSRRTEPARLERQIRGELDWIIMRAMEKDRTRRYASVSELAADVERHLFGEPVAAGPPTAGYRLRKFVRRNRTWVGIAAAGILVLIAFAASMTVEANRIARERDRARLQAERARLESEALQSVLLEKPDPATYLSRMREALALHRSSLAGDDTELALYLVNQLWILSYLDEERGDPGFVQARRELQPEAFATIHRAVAERDSSLLGTIGLMKNLLTGNSPGVSVEEKTDLAELDAIIAVDRDALALRREIRSSGSADLVKNMMTLSENLRRRAAQDLQANRVSRAELDAREAIRLLEEARDTGGAWIWWQNQEAQGLLGDALTRMGRYEEAEAALLESLKNQRREDLLRIIALYDSWGKPAQAERYRAKQLVESIRELGPVADRGAGPSVLFRGRSIWVFRDPGGPWGPHNNTYTWTNDLTPEDGFRLHGPGTMGGELPLLPPTPEEAAFNRAQDRNGSPTRWAVVPRGMILDPGRNRLLIAYEKGLARQHTFEYEPRGFSLAVWERPDAPVIRPVLRPGIEYPTLLFQGEGSGQGAGLLMADGYLYLYWARPVPFNTRITLARVLPAQALDRNAWRFYAETKEPGGSPEWVRDRKDATDIMNGGNTLSVHWNEHLKKYLAVYTGALDHDIRIRTADRPEGPWSPDRVIYRRATLKEAVAHPELSRGRGGRTEYVSYRWDSGFFEEETRLLAVTLR